MAKERLSTDPERRELMQRVRQSGTSTELAVAKVFHQVGLRYRLNVRSLPGSPDLANRTKRWAAFVNGCFWHHHKACTLATTPKRNREFWIAKFADNRTRDARKIWKLRALGFRVIVVWQCQLDDSRQLRERLHKFAKRVS